VFFSEDGGVTWAPAGNATAGFGLGSKEVESYVLFPNGDVLWCGTVNATDGGRLWWTVDGQDWYQLGAPGAGRGNQYQGVYAFIAYLNRIVTSHRLVNFAAGQPTCPIFIDQGQLLAMRGLNEVLRALAVNARLTL
jgi:hypothetical protein